MAYNDALAARVRRLLDGRRDVVEKEMFGGLAFMVRGHMTVGLVNDEVMIRIDPADHDRMLDEPHARPMDFTGRPMRGWLFIEPEGVVTASALKTWVGRALANTDSKAVASRPSTGSASPFHRRPTAATRAVAVADRRSPRTARAASVQASRRRR